MQSSQHLWLGNSSWLEPHHFQEAFNSCLHPFKVRPPAAASPGPKKADSASNLVATCSMIFTLSTIISWISARYRPAQYRINAQAKQASFLVFQIAQQIAAIPKAWNLLPLGNHFLAHFQHWAKFLGLSSASRLRATIIHTTLSTGQTKKRWEMLSSWSQNWWLLSSTKWKTLYQIWTDYGLTWHCFTTGLKGLFIQ